MAGTLRAFEVGRPIASLEELEPSRAVLFDVSARALGEICGDALPRRYRRALRRYRRRESIRLIWRDVNGLDSVAETIDRQFEDPTAAYIHAHNPAAGCFAARIDRA